MSGKMKRNNDTIDLTSRLSVLQQQDVILPIVATILACHLSNKKNVDFDSATCDQRARTRGK